MEPLCSVTSVTDGARSMLVIFRRPSMVTTNKTNSVATIEYLTGKSCYFNFAHLLIELKARKVTK